MTDWIVNPQRPRDPADTRKSPKDWRPRRPDPDHAKCGRCNRTFYAGTLPPQGRERYGRYQGAYLCADCREALKGPKERTQPLF